MKGEWSERVRFEGERRKVRERRRCKGLDEKGDPKEKQGAVFRGKGREE